MEQTIVYGFCVLAALILAAMLFRFRSMAKTWDKQRKTMENSMQDTKEFHDILLIDLRSLLDEQEEISLHLCDSIPLMAEEAEKVNSRARELEQKAVHWKTEFEDVGHGIQSLKKETASLEETAADVLQKTQKTKSCSLSVNDAYREFLEKHEKRIEAANQVQSQADLIEGMLPELSGALQKLSDFADQMELLSLNVNIEAAKGEEQGNGFSVIALEMRKLSEESRDLSDVFAGKSEILDAYMRKNRDSIDKMVKLQEAEQVKITKTGLLLRQMDQEAQKAGQAAGQMPRRIEEIEAAEENALSLLETLTAVENPDKEEWTMSKELQDMLAQAASDSGSLMRITGELRSRIAE